jgi:hypothetical protein
MERILGWALVAACAFGGLGCATVVSGGGGNQKVKIVSEPPGADVTVDGQFVGAAPVEVLLERKSTHIVDLSAGGYEPTRLAVNSRFNPWVIGNVVFGGLIGVVVDLATGATYHLSPDELTVPLRPMAPPATTTAPTSPTGENPSASALPKPAE